MKNQMKKWFYRIINKKEETKTPKQIVSMQFNWGSYFGGRELI
jgi:hypothetical protein